MTRTRFIYSKRRGACFVPHIALAQIFSRTASRSGLELVMTQGFSPRAKISFGPELPAGVVAMNEPVDMFFQDVKDSLLSDMNSALPEGFMISRVIFPDDDSPSLGKLCRHAEYLLRLRSPDHDSDSDSDALAKAAQDFYGDAVLRSEARGGWLRIILTEPARHPVGGLVKHMTGANIITGWHEINIVRVSIGKYNPGLDEVSL